MPEIVSWNVGGGAVPAAHSKDDRAFDVAIYGATGFTGSLVVEYFAKVLSHRIPSLRWAVVGRRSSNVFGFRSRCSLTSLLFFSYTAKKNWFR